MSVAEVFVGWDPSQQDAYEVARFSVTRRASIPVEVKPLIRKQLREQGLYARPDDQLASTEFTYTRFLTPALSTGGAWAVYCDCDFLWLGDLAELLAPLDPAKAVYCVQHDHRPPERTKMHGVPQTVYPRKNWSSLMVFNPAHPACQALTPEVVNTSAPAFLHRMGWVEDDAIGALDETWNWLEGWSERPAKGPPKVIHFTRGGPWLPDWADVDYAELWTSELQQARAQDHRSGEDRVPAAAASTPP